jgi:hypothetical protein
MLVLFPFLCVSASHLTLNQTAHDLLPMRLWDEVVVDVSPTPPLLLVVPSVAGLIATVCMDVNDPGIVSGELKPSSPAFAVLFRAGGRLTVVATGATYFEYFSIALLRPCSLLAVSTAASDSFAATRSDSGANLTMTDGQEICFFHIMNMPTSVSARFSAEDLRFENLGASKILRGTRTFETASAPFFSGFGWTSETATFVDLRFESNSTLPARRGNYSAQDGRPGCPVVISDAPERPAGEQYWNADREWYERPGNAAVTNVIILAIGGCFGLMVAVLTGVCIAEWGRTMMASADQAEHVKILGVADIAGVQHQAEFDEKDELPV